MGPAAVATHRPTWEARPRSPSRTSAIRYQLNIPRWVRELQQQFPQPTIQDRAAQTEGLQVIVDVVPVGIGEGDRVIYPTRYPDPNATPAPPARTPTPEPDRLVIDEHRVNLSDSSSSEE